MGFIKDLKVMMKPVGKSVKEMVPDFQKAIKFKIVKPLLAFLLMGLSVLAIPVWAVILVVSSAFPSLLPQEVSGFSVLLVPAGVIGIAYGWPILQRERVRLSWYCDHCGVPKRVDCEILEKTVKAYVPKRTVVTGSHYEFSRNDSGNVIARQVMETRDEATGGPTKYEIKGKVRVTLECGGCKHQEAFVVEDVSFTSKDKDNYKAAEIEDAVLQKLASNVR